jgi:iron complex transport system substrate-binding protein
VRRRLLTGLACLVALHTASARDVSDATGRTLEVPGNVERVFVAGPPGGLIVYSLAPEKLLGWTRAPSPDELRYLGSNAAKPAYGRLTGRGGEANFELVLKVKPDVVVDIGSTGPTYVSLAERVREQTGVPYLLFDGRLDALPETYRKLGDVLGVQDAAETRAAWIEQRLNAVTAKLTEIPLANRPRVYLARGPEGLETARAGSINVEAVEFAGGRNVAGEALGGGGLVTVTLEQILAWDPDIVVALDPAFAARVRSDPLWAQLRAVRDGKVVLAPQLPFPWVDYPPSVNRVMGVLWLSKLFFPDAFHADLRTEARDFYDLFYHRRPSDAELDELMTHADLK